MDRWKGKDNNSFGQVRLISAQQNLSNSFLPAGARCVVANLWKINAAATAELMKRFYQQMLNSPARLNRTLASPAAQLKMWRERLWQQPFYWAAFVLQGES